MVHHLLLLSNMFILLDQLIILIDQWERLNEFSPEFSHEF